ncbi:hypothetical protein [Nocardioides sp. TF02-7]|uniref:hypothetical protein n=1 Tax=Nocardioides sp. TF02-7 TaxID=2917724 RepID=UPI001F06A8E8|nr:hypothetical protein [Nocardioides sp. TF02-7]UMG91153.1 hypothetical protein MF408_13195 [Nocardioides sp. TF02-7]
MTWERLGRGIFGGPFLKALDVPAAAARLRAAEIAPGMLSIGERALLHELLRRTWSGEGAVVDGGSFFGSSLVAEAQGMLAGSVIEDVPGDRFPDGKPIHGYELGYLPAPQSDRVDRRRVYAGTEYRLGDSFVQILEDTVAPYRDLVALHIGDLQKERWSGAPIEIAFIDVCKTARLNAHVSKEFLPALIGGGSTLVHQDFFFDRLPWIRVTMGYLKDYFRWEGQVFTSSVYRSVKAVPADIAEVDPFLVGTYEECLQLHDAIEYGGIERRYEYHLALSRAYLMALKGRKNEAMDALREVERVYADLLDDADDPRGNRFRLDRASRQISNGNIFKVS